MNEKQVKIYRPCDYHKTHPNHPRWRDCGCRFTLEKVLVEQPSRDDLSRTPEHSGLA